ncbi:hypothetical protein [Streptomyces chattanoogensis]|uniref:hypothetical protein n=1 Tax=Streptomyces chattanoogensis TaxID=66876 RepID=UPI000A81A5A2|nr:hypothetical protein [Streptomyces chattanoogensis]
MAHWVNRTLGVPLLDSTHRFQRVRGPESRNLRVVVIDMLTADTGALLGIALVAARKHWGASPHAAERTQRNAKNHPSQERVVKEEPGGACLGEHTEALRTPGTDGR